MSRKHNARARGLRKLASGKVVDLTREPRADPRPRSLREFLIQAGFIVPQ